MEKDKIKGLVERYAKLLTALKTTGDYERTDEIEIIREVLYSTLKTSDEMKFYHEVRALLLRVFDDFESEYLKPFTPKREDIEI